MLAARCRRAAGARRGRSGRGSCPSRRWRRPSSRRSGRRRGSGRRCGVAHQASSGSSPSAHSPLRGEVVVVARPGQLLRAEAGGEAVGRVLVVGDRRRSGPRWRRALGSAVERQAPRRRCRTSGARGGAAGPAGRPSKPPAAAMAASSGSWRWKACASARSGRRRTCSRRCAKPPASRVEAVGAGGDGEGLGEALDVAAALDLAGGGRARARRSASPSRNQRGGAVRGGRSRWR